MAESQSQGLAFLAKTDNARQIANILSSLHVKKDIEAYVVAESSGLRFTVQKHNCLQMHVYLKRELFNVLECDAKHEFGINLTLLLECLNIFQTSTNFVALQISYAGEGKPLLLVMTDSGGMLPSYGARAPPAPRPRSQPAPSPACPADSPFTTRRTKREM